MTTVHRARVRPGPNGEKDPNDHRDNPNFFAHVDFDVSKESSSDPFDWTSRFKMSDSEIEELADPEWVYLITHEYQPW